MECVTVSQEDYSQTVLDFKAKGMMLASVSTCGVEEGKCRMSFLPKDIQYQLAQVDIGCYISNIWLKEFIHKENNGDN